MSMLSTSSAYRSRREARSCGGFSCHLCLLFAVARSRSAPRCHPGHAHRRLLLLPVSAQMLMSMSLRCSQATTTSTRRSSLSRSTQCPTRAPSKVDGMTSFSYLVLHWVLWSLALGLRASESPWLDTLLTIGHKGGVVLPIPTCRQPCIEFAVLRSDPHPHQHPAASDTKNNPPRIGWHRRPWLNRPIDEKMTTKGHRFHKLLAVLAGLCTAHAFARNRADARVRGNGCSRAFGAVPALTMTTTEQAGSGAGRDALRVVVVGGGWAGT